MPAENFVNSNIRNGNRVLIKMDNVIIGYATSARCSDDYGLEPVHVLGQLQCLEYIPTHARHTISCSLVVMKHQSLMKSNLEPTGAGSYGNLATTGIGAGATPTDPQGSYNGNYPYQETNANPAPGALRILHGKTFDIEIVDQETNTTMVKYKKCYFASGDLEVGANRIMMHNVTFYALDRQGTLSSTEQYS